MSMIQTIDGSLDELEKRVSSLPNAARPVLIRVALVKAKKAWPDKKFELVRLSLSWST